MGKLIRPVDLGCRVFSRDDQLQHEFERNSIIKLQSKKIPIKGYD